MRRRECVSNITELVGKINWRCVITLLRFTSFPLVLLLIHILQSLAKKITDLGSRRLKIVGSLARLDLPSLGLTDDFIFYTDFDVVFNRDITLSQFTSLPKYYACSAGIQQVQVSSCTKNTSNG